MKCVKYLNVIIFLLKLEKNPGHLVLYNAALVIMMVGQICSQNAWHVAPIYPGSLQTDSTQSGPTIQSSHPMSIITTALPFCPIYNSGSTKYGKMCKFEASFQKCLRTFSSLSSKWLYQTHKKRLYSYLGELESSF